MSDVAVLGLAIDSRPVTAAAGELNKLVPAAKAAEGSFGSLEKASTALEKAAASLERSATSLSAKFPTLTKETSAAAASTAAVEKAAKAAEAATAGLGNAASTASAKVKPLGADLGALDRALQATVADINVHNVALANGTTGAVNRAGAGFKGLSFEARNLGFQLVDVTQGALMGQSAFMILAQQGGQLAQIAAFTPNGLGGLFRELGKTFLGLLTPTRLLAAGTAAVGVAAYAMNASWKSSSLQFDNTARSVGSTITQLRALESVASFKGIESDEFLKSSEKFAANIYQARNGMGSLGDVLRANGERATDFAGTLGAAARIIQRATSDQQRLQLLQQMGLPATMEWVRFMSQGGDAIRDAAGASGELNPKLQEMVDKARAFDEGWDTAWKNFKNSAYWAITGAKGLLGDLATWASHLGQDLHPSMLGLRLNNAFGDLEGYRNNALRTGLENVAGRKRGESSVVDPNALRQQLSLEQQRISILGQMASVGQQVRLVEIQIAQARLNGVAISPIEEAALKEQARLRALGVDTIRAQADSYRIEAETVGMSLEKATAYAALYDRLNEAKRTRRVLQEEDVEAIRREADALGAAAARADNLRFEYDTFAGTMREFGANIRNGQTAWQAFGNAASNALGKIADRLMDMASRSLWEAAFPSKGGGGFTSFLSGLFGGGGGDFAGPVGQTAVVGPMPSANGNVFAGPGISAFSGRVVDRPTMFPINDGPIRAFAKGAGLMGEAGPEAIMPLTRTPDGKLGVRSAGGGPIVVEITNHYEFNGIEPGMEARLRKYIDDGDRNSIQQSVQQVATIKSNNPQYLASGVGR